MPLTVVLSVGLDPQLLTTRNLVLQSAGYTVVSAYSTKEAVDRFRGDDFDLVLLCQTVPVNEKDHLTLWIRASGSRIPVVSVSGRLCQDDVPAGVTVGSDPTALLWGIREVLINAANRVARTAMSRDKQDVAATQGKKSPRPSTGFEQQTKTTKARLVRLARTG